MGLRVTNSLTRRREDFLPLHPPRVGVYVCGPTVYSHSHLGHAKSYVSFDTIVRWLRFRGYQVNYVQNITDVGHLTQNDEDRGEDPIIREARARGLHPMAIVDTFMNSYLEDMDALNVARPDIMPRATGHIVEQIDAIQTLIARGHAYAANGSVYFDVTSFPAYGRLSGRRTEDQDAGARVAVNPEKRHPADFALWKRAEPEHIMRWNSPWGAGFPGWHIECSAMSQKYLGDTIDIHGGGLENQFPHHECEIAQAECVTGKPFVRYWLHNNMCTLDGQKMGKSLGNAINLKQMFREGHRLLEKTFEPVVVRHFILTSHYRQTLDFSNEALRGAESGCTRLRDALRELEAAGGLAHSGGGTAPRDTPVPAASDSAPRPSDAIRAALEDIERRFAEAMDEDFNTAIAIATLFDFARQSGEWIRGGVSRGDLAAAALLMRRLTGDALGLRWPRRDAGGASRDDALIQILVDLRNEARKSKNFALADQVRKRLSAIGVELRDGADGTLW